MTKRDNKKILILLITLISIMAIMMGCSIGEQAPLDEFLSEKNLTARVTYYANGGLFDGSTTDYDRDLYYESNSPIINLGKDGSSVRVEKFGYVLSGWAKATLDENGKPKFIKENTGEVEFSLSEQIKFPYRIQEGEHIYLVAIWAEDVYVDFKLVSENEITGSDGNKYQSGDTIKKEYFGTASTVNINPKSVPLQSEDYTYLQLFTNEECTNEVSSNIIEKPQSGNYTLYAKYIKGKYDIVVKDIEDVEKMFNFLDDATKKFYVYKSVDCSEKTFNPIYGIGSTIVGNGNTISNIKFKDKSVSPNDVVATFGQVGATANVTQLTLTNIEVSYTMRLSQTCSVYAVFSSVENGAVFDNITISGLKVTLKGPAGMTISNIQDKQVQEDTQWLYGGYTLDNDFTNQYPTFSLTNEEFEYIS